MALIPKKGISALVYAASEADQVASCLLFIAHSEASSQATIFLQLMTYISGFDQQQAFELVYDADNLVPGKTCLNPASKALSPSRLDDIARHGHCDLYSLSLILKKPCAIKCPPHSGSIAPKHAADPCFRQLATLAKETEVHILFDYSWVHESNRARLRHLIRHLGQFTGFQRRNNVAGQYQLEDWTVFSPAQETESPPSYAEVSHKRPRSPKTRHLNRSQATSESSSPPPKRILLSPLPLSPTEIATPSPKAPSPPSTTTPDFQGAVQAAVKEVLPGLLEAAVADVVRSILRATPSSTSSSSQSPPPVPPLSQSVLKSTRTSARKRTLVGQAKDRVQNFVDKTIDDVAYARVVAVNELHEEVDDCNIEMAVAKQDHIVELEALYNSKVDELREVAADVISEVEDHIAHVYADFRYQTRRDLLRGRDTGVIDDETMIERKKRATSLPL